VERLDEEKLDVLRRWGEGLQHDDREELRAAGRAILLLIEEIEHLHVDLWSERPAAGPTLVEPELPSSLLTRLAHLGRRRSEEAPG
jgi:hypothetical protein